MPLKSPLLVQVRRTPNTDEWRVLLLRHGRLLREVTVVRGARRARRAGRRVARFMRCRVVHLHA